MGPKMGTWSLRRGRLFTILEYHIISPLVASVARCESSRATTCYGMAPLHAAVDRCLQIAPSRSCPHRVVVGPARPWRAGRSDRSQIASGRESVVVSPYLCPAGSLHPLPRKVNSSPHLLRFLSILRALAGQRACTRFALPRKTQREKATTL